VDISFATILEASGHVKGGRLRALGVTSEKRSPALPDVPTARRVGPPGFNTASWIGLLAPVGTPKDIVEKSLARHARSGRPRLTVREQASSTRARHRREHRPDAFAALIDRDRKRYAQIIQERAITAE
jgi:tripartite-type tricarboxylate transporter receptor subunit TctC